MSHAYIYGGGIKDSKDSPIYNVSTEGFDEIAEGVFRYAGVVISAATEAGCDILIVEIVIKTLKDNALI